MRLRARGGRAAARTFIDSLIDDTGGPNRSETRSVRSIPVLTQACVHAGFHNASAEPRKVIYTTWVAVQHLSMVGGMNSGDSELGIVSELALIHPRIRRVLPTDRQHIIVTPEQLESERLKWQETWPPTLRHRYRL